MNIRYPIYEGVYRILTFEQRKYDIFFSQENIIWRQCGLCGRLATIKKKNGIFYHISSNPLQNEVSI